MTSFNPEPVVGQSPIERALSDLQRKTALIERNMNIDTGWIDATLVNGWTDFGGAWAPAAFRRKNGITYIRGLIIPGANAAGAFNLAAGFRPGADIIMQGNTNSTSQIAGRFDILATGPVVPQGAVGWIAVNCSFIAEQ